MECVSVIRSRRPLCIGSGGCVRIDTLGKGPPQVLQIGRHLFMPSPMLMILSSSRPALVNLCCEACSGFRSGLRGCRFSRPCRPDDLRSPSNPRALGASVQLPPLPPSFPSSLPPPSSESWCRFSGPYRPDAMRSRSALLSWSARRERPVAPSPPVLLPLPARARPAQTCLQLGAGSASLEASPPIFGT